VKETAVLLKRKPAPTPAELRKRHVFCGASFFMPKIQPRMVKKLIQPCGIKKKSSISMGMNL
jgi:hypothetical protein